jgi:hypothetical protein
MEASHDDTHSPHYILTLFPIAVIPTTFFLVTGIIGPVTGITLR